MVMHTHNNDQCSQKGDVTGRMEGWEPGTKEGDICNRNGSKVEETKSNSIQI